MTYEELIHSLEDDYFNGQVGNWRRCVDFKIANWTKYSLTLEVAFDAEEALREQLATANTEDDWVSYSGIATICLGYPKSPPFSFQAKYRARIAGKFCAAGTNEVSWEDHRVEDFKEVSRRGTPGG